ncbi:YwiC-like family protein [Rhodopirellula sp. P2]|uniref:YwiC-like family protein n=1 Tax=Rhodopirellula sp. P2 TaxID=2127060 RepID=UPI002368B265|nr:YwiC-like family protein [Rhodopirellula sp. P2]WDQ16788.1 YwiC-like family protein [Rhodopirellula sp. P2]
MAFDATKRLSAEPAAKLKPKEHGAYAILAIPLITSLIVAGLTWGGLCVAAASGAGFLAHEPLDLGRWHCRHGHLDDDPSFRKHLR